MLALLAEGELVACRHELRGTHREAFQGVAPTGRAVTAPATATFRVADGAVQEIWLNADFLGLLQQLGAVPAPADAP